MDINTIAAIISLINMFSQEVRGKEERTFAEFEKWLDRHRHQDLKDTITSTVGLQQELNQILRQDHEEMLSEIAKGNRLLTEFIARQNGFRLLAKRLPEGAMLSEQAIALLKDFLASKRLELFINRQIGFLVIFNNGSMTDKVQWEVNDQRFFQDDIEQLEELGLITMKEVSEHNWKFSLSRSAVEFVKNLDSW